MRLAPQEEKAMALEDTKPESLSWPEKYRSRQKIIYELWEKSGLSITELAERLHIDPSHCRKMLKGLLNWHEKYLDRLAEALGADLESILYGRQTLAILGQLREGEGFPYAQVEKPGEVYGTAPASPGGPEVSGLYVVEVADDSFTSYFSPLTPGTLLYCEKGKGEEIGNGEFGIYLDEEGRANLKIVKYAGDHIILRSPNPAREELIRPRSYLRLMDRVVWVKPKGRKPA